MARAGRDDGGHRTVNAASLTVDGPVAWLRLLLGLALWLAPGLALADRVLAGQRLRWLLAPVASYTLLSLSALALSFWPGVRVTTATTGLLALAWATALWAPRIRAVLAGRTALPQPAWPSRAQWRRVAVAGGAVVAVVAMVAVVHNHPHAGERSWHYDGVLEQNVVFLPSLLSSFHAGYPYPVHVDEHIHMARAAHVARTGDATPADPYLPDPQGEPDWSLRTWVHERGFWVGLGQFQVLTGVTVPALFRFGPALWAGYLAATTWAALRPAPGALASAALLVVLPTNVLFLGVGLLVAIGFSLAWIPALLWVGRSPGPWRLPTMGALVAAAAFLHLVAGIVAAAVALVAILLGPSRPSHRIAAAGLLAGLAAGALYATRSEILPTLGSTRHPLAHDLFSVVTVPLMLLAVAGAAVAFQRRRAQELPHRIAAVSLILVLATLLYALRTGGNSLVLWYRPAHAFFLLLAVLAGLGLGALGQAAWRLAVRLRADPRVAAAARTGLVVVAMALLLPPVVAGHGATPFYRVHSEASWDQVEAFASSGAGPDDRFLSHPWHAPAHNAATGALPHAILYPGGPPRRGADWDHYLETGGADAAWLEARGIRYVVSDVAPNATAVEVAPDVHRLAW